MSKKILIVDDEPFNLDLLEQELADYEYVIERAGDGVEALEKTQSFAPDVILLDYMMPRMNGLEVVKNLRATPQHQGIPVILLTAKASQEDKVAGLDAGADDQPVDDDLDRVVLSPVQPDVFVERPQLAVDARPGEAARPNGLQLLLELPLPAADDRRQHVDALVLRREADDVDDALQGL